MQRFFHWNARVRTITLVITKEYCDTLPIAKKSRLILSKCATPTQSRFSLYRGQGRGQLFDLCLTWGLWRLRVRQPGNAPLTTYTSRRHNSCPLWEERYNHTYVPLPRYWFVRGPDDMNKVIMCEIYHVHVTWRRNNDLAKFFQPHHFKMLSALPVVL